MGQIHFANQIAAVRIMNWQKNSRGFPHLTTGMTLPIMLLLDVSVGSKWAKITSIIYYRVS